MSKSARLKTFGRWSAAAKLREDAAANSAGGGGVAGLGVGVHGEPGVDLRKKRKDLDPLAEMFISRNENIDRCKPFGEHDWRSFSASQTPSRHVMLCDKCGLKMSLARIDQQNKMLSQKRLIVQIRNRPDDDIQEAFEHRAVCQKPGCPEAFHAYVVYADQSKCLSCGSLMFNQIDEAAESPVVDTFAGASVFTVDSGTMMGARFGKNRYHRYSRYVGSDEVGESIRQHGRKTKKDIVLKDSQTGAMVYLRRKKQK